MPPKKKGKGKKKDKKDPNKLTTVDRTFYELNITDLNQKLSRLRSHVAGLDESNVGLAEKLREVEVDRTDVAAHLERMLADRNNTITELEERLVEISKVRAAENRSAEEKITELETKYKAMHDQLSSEIKLLNGKLNSLDEFRIQRDVLLAKFDSQEADLKEKEKEQKEALYNMEQKAVVEKDALKKEVEQKLLQVSEDFTRSSEIRNAGYTRRLIRENIALQREIDSLVTAHIKLQQQISSQMEKHKEIEEQYSALEQIKNELVHNSVTKIKIIEALTKNYEKLKAKYVENLRFRKAYESQQQTDQSEQLKQKNAAAKLENLTKQIEIRTLENKHLVVINEHNERELLRLWSFVHQIKITVRDAIIAEQSATLFPQRLIDAKVDPPEVIQEVQEDAKAFCKLTRMDLLSKLMDLVSSHSEEMPRTASIGGTSMALYAPGKMGFMPQQSKAASNEKNRAGGVPKQLVDVSQQNDEQVTGQAQKTQGNEYSIIDVELGATLYVSTSREEEFVEMEEENPEESEGKKEAPQPSGAGAPHAASLAKSPIPEVSSDHKSSRMAAGHEAQSTAQTGEEQTIEEEDFDINLFY
ncbi:cilia- and flagella-associated protein 157 [Drosophila tropicalis]|uniref:cilia- and flagella-associated protein 157 n=1 Tax=Drosophila tropicalis TaxID=46794 RepID=UPI0035AC0A5E